MKKWHARTTADGVAGGFGSVDEKGRISIPARVREAVGLEPGSSVAYIALGDAVMIVPQDAHLATLMSQAEAALADAGRTVQDLLDALPAARAAVVREEYGSEFMDQ